MKCPICGAEMAGNGYCLKCGYCIDKSTIPSEVIIFDENGNLTTGTSGSSDDKKDDEEN